MRQRIKLITTL